MAAVDRVAIATRKRKDSIEHRMRNRYASFIYTSTEQRSVGFDVHTVDLDVIDPAVLRPPADVRSALVICRLSFGSIDIGFGVP